MRTFVGLEIPPRLVERLDEITRPHRQGLPDARWIPSKNWHLTLAFLGTTSKDQLVALSERLRASLAEASRPRLGLAEFGAFPSRGRAKVAWIGLAGSWELVELRSAVVSSCAAAGFSVDEKPFRPHVSLARARRPWPRLTVTEWLGALPAAPRFSFVPRSVCLFESILGRGKAEYRVLDRFPIG